MGAINDIFSQNKLSFSKISEILNTLLSQEASKAQNTQVLQEIGFLKEFSYITSDRVSNEIIYYSNNNKILKNVIMGEQLRDNFLEWTKYLFDINDEELASIQNLNKKIDNLKRKPLTIDFFQNNIKKHLFRNTNFQKLLEFGIPNNFRYFIWNIIISIKYNRNHYYNYNQELKEYKSILEKQVNNPQIEKDINRTFISYNEQTNNNFKILRNILNCINKYNESGYCQGMNFIIGYLLKVSNFDEVRTFYIFKSILFDIKGYFEEGFPLLKKNTNIFNKYFKQLYPKLHKHFQKYEILNDFWVGKWFQTLFTLCVQFEELNIIWDILLIKGFDFIIYISLAIVDFIEKDILELKDSSDIIAFFDNVLNPKANVSVNKNYFEAIDNYIIPINEVISKAFELERKLNLNSNKNIDNRMHYIGRKSDNHLANFKFNNLSSSLNTEKEVKADSKMSSKFLNNQYSSSTEPSSHNNPKKSTFQNVEFQNNNYSKFNSSDEKINNILSMKNLPIYDFTFSRKPDKKKTVVLNSHHLNFNLLNNSNNFNFAPKPIQNSFINNANNVGYINSNLIYYP
jgi:hypothetical protein